MQLSNYGQKDVLRAARFDRGTAWPVVPRSSYNVFPSVGVEGIYQCNLLLCILWTNHF